MSPVGPHILGAKGTKNSPPVPPIPKFDRRSRRILWSMVSNAPERSRRNLQGRTPPVEVLSELTSGINSRRHGAWSVKQSKSQAEGYKIAESFRTADLFQQQPEEILTVCAAPGLSQAQSSSSYSLKGAAPGSLHSCSASETSPQAVCCLC